MENKMADTRPELTPEEQQLCAFIKRARMRRWTGMACGEITSAEAFAMPAAAVIANRHR